MNWLINYFLKKSRWVHSAAGLLWAVTHAHSEIHKASQRCKCRMSLFIQEETPRNGRYDWFSPAYQRRRPCVAEIACGECVTESVWLELDSAVKHCFISCISITVHCGPCAHQRRSSQHCLLLQQSFSEVASWCPCLLKYIAQRYSRKRRE